jgi:non-specific serine/threonine protein kinase
MVGLTVISCGKLAAVIPFMERLRAVDPLDPWNWLLQGFYHFFAGQYELALEPLRKYYERDPDNGIAQFFYAWSLMHAEELDEAFSIVDRSEKATPDNVFTKFALLLKYGLLKESEKVFREMTTDFRKTCRRDHQWSYFVAVPLALIDARSESLDWLENAVDKGFINYPDLERNPYLDNIRGEERFKKLMERVKYEWEHFEV